YMPVGRHYGFIYNQYDNARTIAHELAHGALSLSHTFADGSESYLGPKGTTANLMDYNGGTVLNHIQWQWAHETHRNILGFLDDESEGESGQQMTEEYLYKNYILKNNLSLSDLWNPQELLDDIRKERESLFSITKDEATNRYEVDLCAMLERFGYECETKISEIKEDDYKTIKESYMVAHYVVKNAYSLFLADNALDNNKFDAFLNYFYSKLTEAEKDKKNELADPAIYVRGAKFDTQSLERDVKEYLLRKDKKYLTARTEKDLAEKSTQYYRMLYLYGYNLYRNSEYSAMQQQFKDYCIAVGEQIKLFSTEWHQLTEKERKEWEAKLAGDAKLRKILSASKTQAVKDIVLGGAGTIISTGVIVIKVIATGPGEAKDIWWDVAGLIYSFDQMVGGIRMWNAANTRLFDPDKEYKFIKGMIIDEFGDYGATIYDFGNFAVDIRNIKEIRKIKGSDLNELITLLSGSYSASTRVEDYFYKILY
ncbi:MAG: HMG-box domain-containing protein, partial [Bacteroidales bacterium]|nr:HMG-box domain-containing protein [Bacteroidales bacterium]